MNKCTCDNRNIIMDYTAANLPNCTLEYLNTHPLDGDDLTRRLLHLLQLLDEVPEARLRRDKVRGEDVHFVQLRVGLLWRGVGTTH